MTTYSFTITVHVHVEESPLERMARESQSLQLAAELPELLAARFPTHPALERLNDRIKASGPEYLRRSEA